MDDKGVWSGERPGGEARPVEEARVERDERAVRELLLEDLEVGAQLVPLELRDDGLNVLVEHDELRARLYLRVTCMVGMVVMTPLRASRGTLAGGTWRSGRRPALSGVPCRCQRAPGTAASDR